MSLAGKLICFTGTLTGKRADAKKAAEAAGAKVGSSVTGKTDILVTGSGVGAAKIQGAQAKGVEVWDEDTFNAAVGGGGSSKAAPAKKAAAKKKAPAKRKAGGGAAAAAPTAAPAKKKAKTSGGGGNIPVDKGLAECGKSIPGASVHEDFAWLGNQVVLQDNANKFYRGQVLVGSGGQAYSWTRWGRVGERGQNGLAGPMGLADAIKHFKSKFKSKSTYAWKGGEADYGDSSKYTVIHEKHSGEQGDKLSAAGLGGEDEDAVPIKYAPATVKGKLAAFVNFVTNADMFKEQLVSMGVDISKMPLGDIDQRTIDSGMGALLEIEAEYKKKRPNKATLMDLSGKFYSYIPHAFGRKVPPVVTSEDVQKKKDMLNIIGDVGAAVQSQKKKKKKKGGKAAKVVTEPAIVDTKYDSLECQLTSVAADSEEFEYVKTYTENTQGYRKCEVTDVFSVGDCANAAEFAKATKKIGNRKLLWHGTNVAVVAAILKSGLRIMPHSGGRVGSGVYLASENGKSAGYCTAQGHDGIMFLVEAALGKQRFITQDGQVSWNDKDPVSAGGFDSCQAVGGTEPNAKQDIEVELDGQKVTVPQGKVAANPACKGGSSFSQSEYLLYKESQVRIRYVIRMKFETAGGSWH